MNRNETIAEIEHAADVWFEQNRDRFMAVEPTEYLKNALRRAGCARAEAESNRPAKVRCADRSDKSHP